MGPNGGSAASASAVPDILYEKNGFYASNRQIGDKFFLNFDSGQPMQNFSGCFGLTREYLMIYRGLSFLAAL